MKHIRHRKSKNKYNAPKEDYPLPTTRVKYTGDNKLISTMLEMDKRIFTYNISEGDPAKLILVGKKNIFLPNLMIDHEISHFVEMKNNQRLLLDDLGLEFFGDNKISRTTIFSALSRETRVLAIQLHLSKVESNSVLYNILKNDLWFDAADKYLPFGRFSKMKDVQDWVFDIRDKTFFAWNEDRIMHEWKSKLEFIQNWMETSETQLIKVNNRFYNV